MYYLILVARSGEVTILEKGEELQHMEYAHGNVVDDYNHMEEKAYLVDDENNCIFSGEVPPELRNFTDEEISIPIHASRNSTEIVEFKKLSDFTKIVRELHDNASLWGIHYDKDGKPVAEELGGIFHKNIIK